MLVWSCQIRCSMAPGVRAYSHHGHHAPRALGSQSSPRLWAQELQGLLAFPCIPCVLSLITLAHFPL